MRLSIPEIRERLVEIWGNKCHYCDKKFTESLPMTIDHFYPQEWCKKQGWTYDQIWDMDNLRPACRPCNVRKGNVVPDEDGNFDMPERRVRVPKAQRPELRECCNSGRLVWPGDRCDECGSPAMPAEAPAAIQVKPSDCDHAEFHCWACILGFVERTSTAWWLVAGTRDS